jgi:GNAT superfamily N-acetyltransferase
MTLPGWTTTGELDPADPILAPLREVYPGFDVWLTKVIAERRPARILRDAAGGTRALLIAKPEPGALKICSLVVRPDLRNQGIGSGLVREALELARLLGLSRVWATAFAAPATLAAFAAAGLGPESALPSGELVLARPIDRLSAVRLFHERMGQIVGDGFAWRDEDLRRFLRHEELREVAEALRSGDIEAVAGELTDVIYVVYGDAVACGFGLPTPAAPTYLLPPAVPNETIVADLIATLERAAAAVDAVWAARADEATALTAYAGLVAAVDEAAAVCGLDIAPFLAEIERANLEKEAVAGGKARKPAGWRPPRLAKILAAEART